MSASPPNFWQIRAGVPWVDPKSGIPTREFYRLMNNLFQAAGSGSAPFLTEVAAVAFSQKSPVDYAAAIGELTAKLMSPPSEAGRIAALERRVADLQEIVMSLKTPPDLNPLATRVDELTAFSMAR